MRIAEIGHNNPPSEKEILEQRLMDYKEISSEIDRLSGKEIPEKIETPEIAGEITAHIKAVKGVGKKVSDIHKNEKAIYLECGRVVDAWKKQWETKIDALVKAASIPLLAYQAEEERKERERQLEIAKKAREEAEKLAAEAEAHAKEGIEDTANDLMNMAIDSEQKANMIQQSSLSVKAHTRHESGAVSSTSKVWTGEIESLAALDLDKLRSYISQDALDRAVKAYAKDTKGAELRGARIYQEAKLNIR